MRRVADADEPRLVPLPQAIDRNREQLDVIPAFEFVDAVAQVRRRLGHAIAERRQAALLHRVDATLWNDEGALPIVTTVEHDHHAAGLDMAESFRGIRDAA